MFTRSQAKFRKKANEGQFNAVDLKKAGARLHKQIPLSRLKEYFGIKENDETAAR